MLSGGPGLRPHGGVVVVGERVPGPVGRGSRGLRSRVAVVTLDLPSRRNSMSAAMTASWVRLMADLRADGELAAIVVTGAPPVFSAGGDLS